MQTAYIIVEQDGGKWVQRSIARDDIDSAKDGYYHIIKVENGCIYFLVDVVTLGSPVWEKQSVRAI